MRFHDLRHSTATILLWAGVPMQHVQKILRHANIRTTVDLHGHMIAEDARHAGAT
jgi:site-specific recombinase XerD